MGVVHQRDAFGRGLKLVGQIQTCHRDWRPTRKHRRSGIRVKPNIELGGWRAIAESTTPHQRDSCNATCQIGRPRERKRNVGERPSGHEPHVIARTHRVDDEIDCRGRVSRARWLGQHSAIHAALAVHIIGEYWWRDERSVRTRVQRCY